MKNKALVLILIALALVVIGFVLMRQKAEAPSPEGETATTTALEEADEPEVSLKGTLGPERVLRSWQGGGTTVTLYEQDLLAGEDYDTGLRSQQILRSSQGKGQEITLDYYLASEYKSMTVDEVRISPLGTYVTALLNGYESSPAQTYVAATGEAVISGYQRKVPYWTHDEKKAAVIQSDSGIDGTPLAFFYSSTGDIREAKPLKEFSVLTHSLRSTTQVGDTVTMLVDVSDEGGSVVRQQKYTLNLQTGSVTTSP